MIRLFLVLLATAEPGAETPPPASVVQPSESARSRANADTVRAAQPSYQAKMLLGVAERAMGNDLAELLRDVHKLDWDEQAREIDHVLSNVWRQNGWNDEADQFARELARDVSQVPPWEFTRRFDLATSRVADRYGLDDASRGKLRGVIAREAAGMFVRHAPMMAAHGREFLAARLRGQPFDAGQVSRWAADDERIMPEVRECVQRLVNEIQPLMPEDRREVLQRDVASFQRRAAYIDTMRERWKRGEWRPEDWGLQDDPIHRATSQARPDEPAVAPQAEPVQSEPAMSAPPEPRHWKSYDPKTWRAFVREMETELKMDAGQRVAAWSVHDELKLRATEYLNLHRDAAGLVPERERGEHPVYEPVRTLFAEMQARLDAIPTTAQRSQHQPQPSTP